MSLFIASFSFNIHHLIVVPSAAASGNLVAMHMLKPQYKFTEPHPLRGALQVILMHGDI